MNNPNDNKQTLLELARKNKQKFAFWNFFQPNTDRSYEDLIASIESGELTLNKVPANKWAANNPGIAGYMTGDRKSINVPDNATDETLGHEMLHFFTSHTNVNSPNSIVDERGEGFGTSSYISLGEKYRRFDRDKAAGWLPSLNPFAPRPTLPGNNPLSEAWNKYVATPKSAMEFDRKEGYGTLSGSSQFDKLFGEFRNDYKKDNHRHSSPVPVSKPIDNKPPIGKKLNLRYNKDGKLELITGTLTDYLKPRY
jgi:hypothetical protein